MNSLNDAISVVHEPDSCSVISLISLAGKMARTGVEDLVSVFLCRLIGVDFQGGQSRHLFDGGDSVADRCPEDLGDIACRIGADQQNSLALSGQVDSCGTRDACLAHTALASEEEVPWGLSKEFHHHNSRGHRRDQRQPDSVEGALVESQHPPTAGTGSMVCEPQQDEGVAVSEEQHSVREVSVRPA